MKRVTLLTLLLLLVGATLQAQTQTTPPSAAAPAATAPKAAAPAANAAVPNGASKIAVVDFERAVTGTAEGKKAAEQFNGEIQKRQTAMQAKNKEGQDLQTKLQTQDKVLSDSQKAEYTKRIETLQTELTRDNEDAQRELGDIQQKLFSPIAERVKQAIDSYAAENGYGLVLDSSSQYNNIMFSSEIADITTEIIRRVDSTVPKTTAPAPRTSAPAGGARPANPPSATPKAPVPDATKKPNP